MASSIHGILKIDKMVISKFKVLRQFTHTEWDTTVPGEPNFVFRPWLEEHIGKQGDAWDWKLQKGSDEFVEIHFKLEEDAIMFELSWAFKEKK